MGLNELELLIISTKAMRFSEGEARAYLTMKGYPMSRITYYRTLGHISSETRKRAFEIAKSFLEDHIQVCDELDNIKKIMYQEALQESDHLKKTMILAKITETMIPYISAYREATKQIIEEVKKKVGNQEENINLSSLGI